MELNTLLDHTSDIILSFNSDFKITFFNSILKKRLHSIGKRIALGIDVFDVVPENKKEYYKLIYDRVLAGESVTTTTQFDIENCESVYVEEIYHPVYNSKKRIEGVSVISRDVSKRIKVENKLLKAQRQLKEIISSIPGNVYQLVMDTEFNFNFQFISNSVSKIFGLGQAAVYSNAGALFDLVHKDDQKYLYESLHVSALNLSHWHLEFRINKTQTFKWIKGSAFPHKKKNDCIVWTGSFVDCTKNKILELSLKDKNAELIKINAELIKTNAELDRFVYSASHDLRAPLTSILGLVNIAEFEAKETVQLKYLGMIRESVMKLDGFIFDIINYSRNARMEFQYENINIRQILSETIENYRFLKGFHKIKITVELKNTMAFISDKSRICILLNNLISNAIKYHTLTRVERYIKISIKIGAKEATFKIEDNGQGIHTDHHKKVFDMFYRASEYSVGSGLGLYIVKEIVQKLNGSIKMKSVLNEGTSFQFKVPNYLH